MLDVELVELSLEADELDAELVVEAVEVLLVELVESAFCSARSRVCRSLLSFEVESDRGGGGGGGPPAGGGPFPGGGAAPADAEALDAELAVDVVEALLVELAVEAEACREAARSSCKSCHAETPPDAPTDPIDMADTLQRHFDRCTRAALAERERRFG